MPEQQQTYEITDPVTKRTIEMTGPRQPTETEIRLAFAALNAKDAKAAPPVEPKRSLVSRAALGAVHAMVPPATSAPTMGQQYKQITDLVKDLVIGGAKGAAGTVAELGRVVAPVVTPGLADGLPPAEMLASGLGLDPTNTTQRVGRGIEQMAEFLIPASAGEKVAATVATKIAPAFRNAPRLVQAAAKVAPRAVTEAVSAGSVTALQHGDAPTAAVLAGAMPVAGRVATAAAPKLNVIAEKFVRAAVKPTVAAMRQIAGASVTGIDAQANRLVRFIIDQRLTSPDKARKLIAQAESDLKIVLAGKNAVTDAPQRALRYLNALERSAARQGLPSHDVATIRNAAAEVLETGLGEDMVTMVAKAHPTLVDASGKPLMVLEPKITRVLRSDVKADEALDRARKTSQWDTRKAYGEMKGASMEASKATERALRDAAKEAVPELRPILRMESQAIQARNVLDRAAFRAANRDTVSLPGGVATATEVAADRLPVIGFATQWLRNNQARAGIWADKLAKAIEKKNVAEVSAILGRLGVGATAQATK